LRPRKAFKTLIYKKEDIIEAANFDLGSHSLPSFNLLSLIYGILVLPLVIFWGTSLFSFIILRFLCLTIMRQNFSCSYNIIFSLSPLSSFILFLRLCLCVLAIIATPSRNSFTYLSTLSMLSIFLVLSFSSSNIINFYV